MNHFKGGLTFPFYFYDTYMTKTKVKLKKTLVGKVFYREYERPNSNNAKRNFSKCMC